MEISTFYVNVSTFSDFSNSGNYEVTQDIKQQLRFLEDLDKMEKKRHEEAERELLLRAAKSRYNET